MLVGWFYGDRIMQLLVQGKSPYAIGEKSITLAFIGGAVVSLWGLSQSYFQAHQRFTMFSGLRVLQLPASSRSRHLPRRAQRRLCPSLDDHVCCRAADDDDGVLGTDLPWRVFVTRPDSQVLGELAVFGAWVSTL